MLTSLSFIFLAGLAMAALCERLKLPRIIGMLIAGVVLGPYALGLLDASILSISAQLRQMALIIILIKAGLSFDLSDLKRVGRPAVMMSCIPAGFEIFGYVLLAPRLLGVTRIEAAVMGAVLSAVSPAVVIPRMIKLMDEGYGISKSIPQLIMAGASCDDIFVIVLFSSFLQMAQGGRADVMEFVNIPISVLSGIALGAAFGLAMSSIFRAAYTRMHPVCSSTKTIIILGTAFLLMAVETWAKNYMAVSGLLAIISMACTLRLRSPESVSKSLSENFGKLWIAAEVILFVLVGAAVDIRCTLDAGITAVGMILAALLFRTAGVMICLIKTPLTFRERIFCAISYIPKATVQAAIGSVPLGLGLPCGSIVLSVAVLGIMITAPLGAIGMDMSYKKLLGVRN